MQPFLTSDAQRILRDFCRVPTLFAFDYDGTLAPLVDKAHEAYMPEATAASLRTLAGLRPTAVITGRARRDVARFLGPEIKYVVGNHGIEGLPGGERFELAARAAASAWHRALIQRPFSDPLLHIEAKDYSLTVHSRGVADAAAAQATIMHALTELQPAPRIVLGKDVVNLVSVDAPHKGHAMQELLRESGCEVGVFVGDDVTDDDVFNLADPRILGIRVGAHPSSRAPYFVEKQADVDAVLTLLCDVARAQH